MAPDSLAANASTQVIVVGGGLSGLTVAYRLLELGHSVEVLEAAQRAGGSIGSRRHALDDAGEALYEDGPNSGLDTSPRVNELLHSLGIFDQRVNAAKAAAKRYVLRGGRLHAVPANPLAFLTSGLLSWRSKLAVLREPFVARAAPEPDESVAHFVERRLSREFLDYAVEPLVGGIYAGDPREISLAAAFPRLRNLEQTYGGLIRGAIAGARERRRKAREGGGVSRHIAQSFSFRGGMQTLTDTLALRVGRVVCAARAEGIRLNVDGSFAVDVERRGERFERYARAVVLAVPAHEAAGLVRALDAGAARALEGIAYPPVATVSNVYRRGDVAHPLDGFGFLAPRAEQPPVLGTLFISSMFADRAPAGYVLLTSFVGGRRNPELALRSEREIAEDVARSNERFLGARAPVFTAVRRWPHAIPQYALGHNDRLASVAQLEQRLPGLSFCCNWRGGVSISDCISAGMKEAERIAAALAQVRSH